MFNQGRPCNICKHYAADIGYKDCNLCYEIGGGMTKKELEYMSRIIINKLRRSKNVQHRSCKRHNCISKSEWRYYKKRIEKKGGNIKEADFFYITNADCFYCGIPKSGGIDRLINDIGYFHNNCVPCCSLCNYMKNELNYQCKSTCEEIDNLHRNNPDPNGGKGCSGVY